jgi:substrate import-associated zinc metallohydrolase lipoprotein
MSMRTYLRFRPIFFVTLLLCTFSCFKEDELDVAKKPAPVSNDPLDLYVQENFIEEYGIAVRFKFVDRYVDQTKRVTPPRREGVIPMLEFLTKYWIEPFMDAENGERFFRSQVPAEVIFIGSSIYNEDGTVTLGTADAGARITLTEVNDINLQDQFWILRQLGTIYHEFAHIMHQRYNLPPNWQQISPQGYTSSGSWYNISEEDALRRGFVSPYGTSSYNEDFAELVAFLLFDKDFFNTYINEETNCTDAACVARNEGRVRLRRKYNSVLTHYKQNTGVDLLEVRSLIQQKLQ